MHHRIGLVYIPGALPCFEQFGNLPTDLVHADGLVDGKPAEEVLDMIIVPGGSLVESQTIKTAVARQITRMAETGKFVLGICSGFQILSTGTDIGRLSPKPIVKDGLGLLDVRFEPLICTDQVKATVVGVSHLTDAVGAEVAGFHCHTYGKITVGKEANPILVSHVKRQDYRKNPGDLTSGVCNGERNIVGILMHAVLDQNPLVIEGITRSLDIKNNHLEEIRAANVKLQARMKSEIGISTGIPLKTLVEKPKSPRALLITALESGGGKTFVVTGLAGALKKRGVNVGIIKVGGDIRDIVPALYLIKEPMQPYSSITVAEAGWRPGAEVMKASGEQYELVIIEGAMNMFTGILYEGTKKPNSTAEAVAPLGIPVVIVAGCDKEGIEGGLISALNYVRFLKTLDVKAVGVILNKVYLRYVTGDIKRFIEQACASAGVELLGLLPIVEAQGRGLIPEVEIRYEDFCAKALEVAEGHMNLDKVLSAAAAPSVTSTTAETFVQKFKDALTKPPK